MKTKIYMSIVFILLLTYGYGQNVILKTPTGNIAGTLLVPPSDGPVPVALLIAGSGDSDRNGNNSVIKPNTLKMIADSLYAHGIASLRYDKRGAGESKSAVKDEWSLRFETYIHDAEGWVDWLAQKNQFSSIIVIGHSQGSLIGMIASQKKSVSKFISLAGIGESIDKVIRKQLSAQPVFVTQPANQILDSLVKGKTADSVPKMLYSLFRPSVQPYLMSWIRYNPQDEIKKLGSKPVFIIQGTTDLQVESGEAEILSKADPYAKVVMINGMNHVLKSAPADRQLNLKTYYNSETPIHGELVKVMVKFIKN